MADVMDARFLPCPVCDGSGETIYGVSIYEAGCGFPHAYDFGRACDNCDGTGKVEIQVEPIECDDDPREQEARAYCAAHGLNPDDDAADGVLVWQVVAKERLNA